MRRQPAVTEGGCECGGAGDGWVNGVNVGDSRPSLRLSRETLNLAGLYTYSENKPGTESGVSVMGPALYHRSGSNRESVIVCVAAWVRL